MPKFYVKSGKVRRVIDGTDALAAAYAVIHAHAYTAERRCKGTETIDQLGLMTCVSERGFYSKEREAFSTHSIMVSEGPFERFRWEKP
jgi:hypothetical protein